MKKLLLNDCYPVNKLLIEKDKTSYPNAQALIDALKKRIEEHPVATYIGEFDHYAHTVNLPEHRIDESFQAVKIILFCFGKELPAPEMAAVRPRSIAVVERKDDFIVSFMDAPNPTAQETMIQWVNALQTV